MRQLIAMLPDVHPFFAQMATCRDLVHMHDVFISYARQEQGLALPVARLLSEMALDVFMDVNNIEAGNAFPFVIDKALKSSKAVVACWSPLAFTREWVMNECVVAKFRKTLVPVAVSRLSPLDVRVDFVSLDFADLSDWKGDSRHPGVQKMLRALSILVGRQLAPNDGKNWLEDIGGAEALAVQLDEKTPGSWRDRLSPAQCNAIKALARGSYPDNQKQKVIDALWGRWRQADDYVNQDGADATREYALLLTEFKDRRAAASLAEIFRTGFGVPKDQDTADLWQRRANGDWS